MENGRWKTKTNLEIENLKSQITNIMDHLWSPWRYTYIASADRGIGCVFCRIDQEHKDDANYVVYRGRLNFIILNLFPYTSGHLMIVPYEHRASFAETGEDTTTEMTELAKRAQRALETEYRPDGFNIGMNLGRSAGAGVADHLHMHVVPRWSGDANFVSIIGETRVLPEDLATTSSRLRRYFD
jgi:ATP adenylyltransferase